MENKKQAIVLSCVAIVALLALIIGATFAYFQAKSNNGSNTNVNVTTYTSDLLTFEIGSDIVVYADQTSFASGKGNATGSTFAKAILTANNKTNTATKNYYVYLNISENTFTYTQNTSTPELLLTITDASGNAITSISGLTYKTVTDGKGASISGFDITTKSGLVTLFDSREITASPAKTEEWNITVIFVNYNTNQTGNAGKSFNAKLTIQQEEYELTMADICVGKYLKDCVILQYTGIQGENGIYHHNGTIKSDDNTVLDATDNSYRYSGGDYVLTEKGKATGAITLARYHNNATTALIDFYCNKNKQYLGSSCNSSYTSYFLIKGNSTQYSTYNEALDAAIESGLITKNNIKNFVCFGTTENPCPTDNLYRIIGVIGGKVKLIKNDYANSNLLGTDGEYGELVTLSSRHYIGNLTSVSKYYWNKDAGTNAWSTSLLNKTNLNTNFINNIGTEWANKIATTIWKVGGGVEDNLRGASKVPTMSYMYEVGSSASNTTYEAKIGLMYVSDYYYGASPSAWILKGYYHDSSNPDNCYGCTNDYRITKNENWLHRGYEEWTITRKSENSYSAFYITNSESIRGLGTHIATAVRPVFFLEPTVTYVSGTGTQSDPIIIN
mgnify:CR=1 FL=1